MGLLLSRNALNYQATFSNFIRIYFFSCQLTLILSLICSILRKYTIKVTLYICNEKRYVYQQISFQRLSINNNKNVEFYHLFLSIVFFCHFQSSFHTLPSSFTLPCSPQTVPKPFVQMQRHITWDHSANWAGPTCSPFQAVRSPRFVHISLGILMCSLRNVTLLRYSGNGTQA